MIGVLHYGLGNIASLLSMMEELDIPAVMVQSEEAMRKCEKFILPGVGAFDEAMIRLRERGWDEILSEIVLAQKKPVLGVCLGLQLLFEGSEEGHEKGLGFLDGKVVALRRHIGPHLPVPHMGWNYVSYEKPSPLTKALGPEARFYFAHSYFVQPRDPNTVVLTTEYGIPFPCAIEKEHIMGVQFHPERSHSFGMQILKNFWAI
ncbi:MAG: imidazole glycerol phosphate synthase subunit HisH [Flavobacteriales bacterium]|nr:imidazole glycerol phosphate synthase subunit HisH [Flavobacteriales bacterium]